MRVRVLAALVLSVAACTTLRPVEPDELRGQIRPSGCGLLRQMPPPLSWAPQRCWATR
jgi:hypothetical protein